MRILLHLCCGVCAAGSIEKLKSEGFSVSGYFYNPNIYPHQEYLLRKKQLEKVMPLFNTEIINSRYESSIWRKICGSYKDEKEGGRRCELCFYLRLQATAKKAKLEKFDYFTTSLTISPHKNSKKILKIGEDIGGNRFLKIDFKKKEGFKKTLAQAKELRLYRQKYCGCIYSR